MTSSIQAPVRSRSITACATRRGGSNNDLACHWLTTAFSQTTHHDAAIHMYQHFQRNTSLISAATDYRPHRSLAVRALPCLRPSASVYHVGCCCSSTQEAYVTVLERESVLCFTLNIRASYHGGCIDLCLNPVCRYQLTIEL